MRQEVTRLVHHIDAEVLVLDADVDMHAANQHALNNTLHVVDHALVTIGMGVDLILPIGIGMGRGGNRC